MLAFHASIATGTIQMTKTAMHPSGLRKISSAMPSPRVPHGIPDQRSPAWPSRPISMVCRVRSSRFGIARIVAQSKCRSERLRAPPQSPRSRVDRKRGRNRRAHDPAIADFSRNRQRGRATQGFWDCPARPIYGIIRLTTTYGTGSPVNLADAEPCLNEGAAIFLRRLVFIGRSFASSCWVLGYSKIAERPETEISFLNARFEARIHSRS